MRNKTALPKHSNRPILMYWNVNKFDDRAYIVYPNGRHETMDLADLDGDPTFHGRSASNNPGQGYERVRYVFSLRKKELNWKLLHWEYL